MCYRFDLFYYDYSTVFGTNRLFSIQYKATQYCNLLEIQLRPQSDGPKHLHNNQPWRNTMFDEYCCSCWTCHLRLSLTHIVKNQSGVGVTRVVINGSERRTSSWNCLLSSFRYGRCVITITIRLRLAKWPLSSMRALILAQYTTVTAWTRVLWHRSVIEIMRGGVSYCQGVSFWKH
jgi:hypothetical protein